MSKHTPGPWKVRDPAHSGRWTDDLIVVDPTAEGRSRMLAHVGPRGDAETRSASAEMHS